MSAAGPQDDPRRHVALRGAYNARDLGGYPTLDNRRVRWGRVYRSSALSQATADDGHGGVVTKTVALTV